MLCIYFIHEAWFGYAPTSLNRTKHLQWIKIISMNYLQLGKFIFNSTIEKRPTPIATFIRSLFQRITSSIYLIGVATNKNSIDTTIIDTEHRQEQFLTSIMYLDDFGEENFSSFWNVHFHPFWQKMLSMNSLFCRQNCKKKKVMG